MTRCMGCMKEYGEGVDVCPHCGYARGTAAREAYHLAPESILAGKYIVGRVLGFGGFGVTYIGYDAQLDRVVAIKEFLPTAFATRMPGGTAVTVYEGGATSQFGFGLERFVQEAQRLAQFNGIPGITDIYDTFVGNNTAYIVMQYLQGSDVKQALQAGGPMPYEKARDIVLRICDTLAPVHAKGVIHRDISPDNIFLTADGEVKLLDFGAARYESSVNSKSLSVILKSGYAPEEQYRSRGDQGPWTDVYALAATFYKMLTGITPPDSMERAVKDEIREPSKLGADIPQSAENALMNALNIRKSDRTQSVQEFKEALQADGVERVKVKARRAQTGKVPLPAIVALGIAGVLIVVFIVLNATGTINLGGAMDTFGTPGENGQVTLPDLSGMPEEEALQTLEALGLGMEVIRRDASIDGLEGTVLTQEPLAGRFLAEGKAVQVTVCERSLESLLAGGDVLTWQAEQVISSTPLKNSGSTSSEYQYSSSVNYEFSDTVPEGCVIRYEVLNEQRVDLWVSAGRDDVTEVQGVLRGVHLSNECPVQNGSYARVGYAIAMPSNVADEEGWAQRGLLAFYYSTDGGANWNPILTNNGEAFVQSGGARSGHSGDEENIPGNLTWLDLSISELLAQYTPQLAGQVLTLRVDYHEYVETDDANVGALGRQIQSIQLPQTLTFQFEEPGMPAVTGGEVVSWADIASMIESGEIPEDSYIARQYENNIQPDPNDPEDDGDEEYNTAIRLYGDFEEGKYYRLTSDGYNTEDGYYRGYDMDNSIHCDKNGELIYIKNTGGRYEVGTGEWSSYMLTLGQTYSDSRCTADENGNVTNYTRRVSRVPVVYSQVMAGWDGVTPLDQLVDAAPVPPGLEYQQMQEAADALDEIVDAAKAEEMEKARAEEAG